MTPPPKQWNGTDVGASNLTASGLLICLGKARPSAVGSFLKADLTGNAPPPHADHSQWGASVSRIAFVTR
jgi:hypothetical protein